MRPIRSNKFARAARPVALGFSLLVGSAPNAASADTRQSVDVSVSGKAVSNPYLDAANGSWSGVGSISIDPRISTGNEVTSFVLTGDVRISQYTRRYGADESASIGAAMQTRVSERTVLSGGVNFISSRSSALDVLQIAPSGPSDQTQPLSPDVILPDISTVGQRDRVNRYFAHVGMDRVLSANSGIGFNLSGGYTDTNRPGGQNYARADFALNYRKTLSPRTSFLATMTLGGSDYSGSAFRDAIFMTELVGVKSSLGEHTDLTVQGGATLTRFSGGESHVDLAANVSLCQQWLRSSLCAIGSRSAAPTAYQGVSTFTAAGLTYSLQAGATGRFTIGAHYGQTKGLTDFASSLRRSSTLFGISGEYSRTLATRTFVFVRPSMSRNSSSTFVGSANRTSFQVEIGVRHRFGDIS
jgi:hypothetical protein